MKVFIKVLFGLIFLLGGLYLYAPVRWGGLGWWRQLLTLFQGSIGFILILIGLIFFAISKE